MIKKVESIRELSESIDTDIYSIRILSLLNAYGTSYDFASFYKQIFNGKITAVISKLDYDLTIWKSDADEDELAQFIDTIGYSSCLCSDLKNYSRHYNEGVIMKTQKKAELPIQYAEIDEYPKLMDLFNIEDYNVSQFESWYVDVSHRIRHNCAKAYSLNVNEEIVSSAIFSSIYNNDAILTSVKTVPQFRRRGYASMLVSHMIGDIMGNVYLMRETDKNEEFYKKLGFENIGIWRMYE